MHIIIWRSLNFRQALCNAADKQVDKHISYLLGDSSDNSSLSRIIELSTKINGVLDERTLAEIPRNICCRMVRLASEFPFIILPLNGSRLVAKVCL